MKNILIIGGMGPQASLLTHKRIIDKAVELGAEHGKDFPDITHLSVAVDDFISDTATMAAAVAKLRVSLGYLWRGPVHPCGNSL